MQPIRAQVILATADAIPANYATNSWCFRTPDGLPNTTALTGILKDFYDDCAGLHGPQIAQNGHQVKYTALPGTPPNYPFEEDTFNLAAAPLTGALPDEVAICLSFQGIRQAGFPQRRRRGRIYLGPLRSGAATANRPNPGGLTQIAAAAQTLASAVDALGTDYAWCVWSPTDQLAVPVDNGWLDNAFDTQRRRGVSPTSRTTFVV